MELEHWVRVLLQDGLVEQKTAPHHVRAGLERTARIVERMEPYQFRTDVLDEIADALSDCTELSDLSKLMWDATLAAGFEHYIIFVLKNGSKGAMKSRVCTSCHTDWLDRYQSQGYQYVDPVMAAALTADGIFEFADLDKSSPIVSAFWADALAHRIGDNGLCVARTRPDGARIGVSYLTRKTESQARGLVRLNGSDLVMIADLAMDAFCFASYGISGEQEGLSIEELRFMYLLAAGRNPLEAFAVLPRFGSNKSLQASIRRKLGVETVFQAISLVTARGLLDDVPYVSSEVTRPYPSLVGLDAAAMSLADPGEPWLDEET